ncbi:MAG TPA: histidine phosphatase family protein [Bryobacteraceae bacterium]|nr:histidine phosphatase family protein [Bryobacteraceae bacterium]
MPEIHIRDVVKVIRKGKPEPTNGRAIRRVTGSANIPLNEQGRAQVKQMAAKYSHPFSNVFSGPEDRSLETAEHFGDPITLKGLDAWFRGALEGRPAHTVYAAMRALILKPDSRPPGVSPISGKPGETYKEFLKPLMIVMRAAQEHLRQGERILLVTSGGNLQAIDHFAAEGFPLDPDRKDFIKLAQKPYWSATGQLFFLEKTGLAKVSDNDKPGIYVMEHSSTDFNPTPLSNSANSN